MLNNGSTYLPNAGEGEVPQWFGAYAATVYNNADPLGVGRLQLQIPQVLGNSVSSWAVPLGNYYNVPVLGETVSAMFLGGDPAQPTWVGPLDLAPVVIAGTTRVTYSTTAPSTPDVGDIWYEIFVDGAGNQIISAAQVWTFDPVHSTFSWVVKSTQNSDNGAGVGSAKPGMGTVTGGLTGSLAIGTITADNIHANTITTTQLNANAINGMTISGNTINGGTINGSIFNGTNWIENANGQYFYTGAPLQPGLSTTTTGGTILAGTYDVVVSYVNATGENLNSLNNFITTTGSTSTITIASPAAAGNATGWYAYVSQAGLTVMHRQQAPGSPTPIGTNLTLTAPPTTSGIVPPGATGTGLNTPAFGNLSMALTPLGGNDPFGNNVTKIGFVSQTPDGVIQTQVAAGTVNVTEATNAGANVGPAGFVTGNVNINGNTSVISGATIVTPGVATPGSTVSSATYYASANGFPLALASNDGNVYDLGSAVHDTFVPQTINATTFSTVNGTTFNVISGQRYKFEAFVVYHGSQNAGAPILSFAHPSGNTYTSVAAHEEWSISGSAPSQTNTDLTFLDVTGPTLTTGRFCYMATGFFQPSANQTFVLSAACTVAADTWVIDAAMTQLTPLT